MPSIWKKHADRWRPMAATELADEATLHDLVEDAPELLPLSGSPRLVVVGREVALGGGYADLLAVDQDGQVVILEIKLARNAEARRAVIAQVLAYAAALMGSDRGTFERDILGPHLAKRGYPTLVEAMAQNDQEGRFDAEVFDQGLERCLAEGRFRLVVVLDSAPAELVRIGGFLEAVSERLTVDLVTVSEYTVGDASILVPQRIDPGRAPESAAGSTRPSRTKAHVHEGSEVFAAAIGEAPGDEQARLGRLLQWAQDLEKRGWAWLQSCAGKAHRWTLLPNLAQNRAGLVTLWNENGAAIQFWRTMFEKHAPETLPKIEAHIAPKRLGQGTTTRELDERLLELLTEAYREGVGAR
jgi:hypothetical protein